MRTTSLLCLAAGLLLLASPSMAAEFVESVEAAQGKASYDSHSALHADLTVEFGGKTVIDGELTMDTPGGKVRLAQNTGALAIFDGTDAWLAPADAEFPGARFHVLTWSYFLAVPMKLSDPGTHVEALGRLPLVDGQATETAKLTFGDGVGDTPDDWYILYRDAETHRLAAMAYIVTFGKSAEQAEEEPHAIVYGGWQEIDGVWLPTDWTFYNWSREQGAHGDPLGHVKLKNLHFVDFDATWFTAPTGAKKLDPPPKV